VRRTPSAPEGACLIERIRPDDTAGNTDNLRRAN
jgi:hypothetical protein